MLLHFLKMLNLQTILALKLLIHFFDIFSLNYIEFTSIRSCLYYRFSRTNYSERLLHSLSFNSADSLYLKEVEISRLESRDKTFDLVVLYSR